jgi:hypothetical protein
MSVTALRPNPTVCPSWCGEPAGHQYETGGHQRDRFRWHRVTIARSGSLAVHVSANAYPVGLEEEDVDEPFIDVEVNGGELSLDELDAADARELAAFLPTALITAAELLERIGKVQR